MINIEEFAELFHRELSLEGNVEKKETADTNSGNESTNH